MRVLVSILGVCLFLSGASFAYSIDPVSMVSPNVIRTFTATNNNAGMNYNNINQIEQALFGKIYVSQPLSYRLSRIERRLFTTTYSNLPDNQRLDNIISNFNRLNVNPNISSNSLGRIERMVFDQDYSQNTPQLRIERLEQQLFGATQSGDLSARAKAIEIAAGSYRKNLNASNNNWGTNSYGATNAGGIWGGLLGGLGNTFARGVVTGMSPPLNEPIYNNAMYGPRYNNNNQWTNNFNNPQNSGFYSGVRTPWGYSDRYSNYGSGAGVTILD